MAPIAEDMANGTICSACGCFFQDSSKPDTCFTHGFPVICKECWAEYTPKEQKQSIKNGLQLATANTI